MIGWPAEHVRKMLCTGLSTEITNMLGFANFKHYILCLNVKFEYLTYVQYWWS